MAGKVCPFCGSRYFLSARGENKVVFHVDEEGHFLVASPHDPMAVESAIDPNRIFCGACSWHGAISELVLSDLCV
ncbi:MAG: hypothetical protein ACK5PS_00735 [Desulfopila sp.]